ncbi:phage holin family protein [Thalassospira mesophila]|uniref:phage holin family protein n=1 Tax=Thalassospira mesophila TaxID=1293891 RepID=UPI000A1D7BF3|nr:phage holin family protein [Thalassospira mesophila]
MIDQLIDAIGDMAQAAAARLAAIAIIGLVMLVGTGFVLAAIYMGLAAQVGPVVSALTIGVVLIVLGLVTMAIWFGKSPTFEQDKPDNAHKAGRTEDDIIIDMLMDAAKAGFATGQGDKNGMSQGFERILQNLDGLGTFERRRAAEAAVAQAEAAYAQAQERVARAAGGAADDPGVAGFAVDPDGPDHPDGFDGAKPEPVSDAFSRDPGMTQK